MTSSASLSVDTTRDERRKKIDGGGLLFREKLLHDLAPTSFLFAESNLHKPTGQLMRILRRRACTN